MFADNVFFRAHLWAFIILVALFSVVSGRAVTPGDITTPIMTVPPTSAADDPRNGVFHNDGSRKGMVSPYPVCRMSWGSRNAPVRVLDLAAMAWYAYDNASDHFGTLMSDTFKNAEDIHWDENGNLPRVVASRLCGNSTDTKNKDEECTMIVAVRGTSSKIEIMSDIGIFATAAVLQVLDKITPIFGTLPVTVIGSISAWCRFSFMKHTQEHLLTHIEEVIKNQTTHYPNDVVVITGHSLGGSFAEVTGARLQKPAVGFSAPGQYLLMKNFKTTRKAITNNVVTIMPSMDVVPLVGQHLDMVQRILCQDASGRHRRTWECHSMVNQACELWRVCGDVERRDFSKMCLAGQNPVVNKSCVGRDFGSEDCPAGEVEDDV